jgi:hypothetical protein
MDRRHNPDIVKDASTGLSIQVGYKKCIIFDNSQEIVIYKT